MNFYKKSHYTEGSLYYKLLFGLVKGTQGNSKQMWWEWLTVNNDLSFYTTRHF